ncbi:MAG: hypothetical protein FWC62_04420 [Firmicutes bacterium]|nr:hypothetical protein [Bacillota bacterium]
MKRLSRTFAILLAALMLLTLCACKEPPVISITAAEVKLAAVKSSSYDMDMQIAMSAAGQSFNIDSTVRADYVKDPMLIRMQMSIDMGALGKQDMQMYIQGDRTTYTVYTSTDNGATWTSTTSDNSKVQQYDVVANLGLYVAAAKTFTEVGMEQVSGSSALRFDGAIPEKALNQVLTASGVGQAFSKLGLGDLGSDPFSGVGDLPVSIWVDQQSGYPVKYEMDMTAMMSALMNKLLDSSTSNGAVSVSVDRVLVGVVMSNFNGIGKLEIPAAALGA